MNPFPRTGRLTLSTLAILLLWLAATCPMLAQEEEFAARNCAITPPDGWTRLTDLTTQPGVFGTYRKPDRMALLVLLVDEHNKPTGPIDEQFVAGFEKGVEATGVGPRTSGRFVTVGGLKGYERLGTATIRGKHASTISQVVAADGIYYNMQAMRFDGEAGDDPEIRQALASFRFLKAASPPAARANSAANSNSAAYQMGRVVGSWMVIALVLLVLIVFCVVVAVTVVMVLRRKRKGAPAAPPPLPPVR